MLDSFVDTLAKRHHLFRLCALITFLILLVPYLVLSISLLQVSTYEEAFALLQNAWMERTYVSRVILDVMATATFSFSRILTILIKDISLWEVLGLFFLLVLFPCVEKKKSTTVWMGIFLIAICSIMWLVVTALRSASFQEAITRIQGIGLVLLVVSVLFLLLDGYLLWRQGKAYHAALAYEAIEIKEHTK